jgi:hypothetical protein
MKKDVDCEQVAIEIPEPNAREAAAQKVEGNTVRGNGEPLI